MDLQIKQLNPHFGAEITGLAMTAATADDWFPALRQAFTDYGLLVVRGNPMGMADQVELGRRFGEVQLHEMDQYRREDFPEIYFLTNLDENGQPTGKHPDQGTLYWHTDGSWREHTGLATIMVAEEVPKEGGETHFCCMEAAYAALDDATKSELADLKASHSLDFSRNRRHPHEPLTEAQKSKIPPVSHPLVRTHPESDRKSIFLGDHAECIEGWDYNKGRRFVDEMNERAIQPEHVYAHRYQAGDVVMWDNRRTLHKAMHYDTATEHRVMRRTTVLGDAPF